MPAGIALFIGILICLGAVLGLLSTYHPHSPNEQDRGSLILAFLMGLLLLWLALSGRYVMAPIYW